MHAQLLDINFLAVFAAASANYLLGTVWFSPFLFGHGTLGNLKIRVSDPLNRRRLGELSVSAFLFALITAFVLALLILVTDSRSAALGALLGLIASVGYVVTSIAVDHHMEDRPARQFFVMAGFHTFGFAVMGAVLGAMH